MLNIDELRDYLEAVDELRRLHMVTPKPPTVIAARKIKEQEGKVDALTARYLDRITAPTSSSSAAPSSSAPPG